MNFDSKEICLQVLVLVLFTMANLLRISNSEFCGLIFSIKESFFLVLLLDSNLL